MKKSKGVAVPGAVVKFPFNPPPHILVKLGSIAVHVEEYFSPHGHPNDKAAIESILQDKGLQQWIKDMGVLMPLKRDNHA